jgi:hypothetical protein
MKNLLSVLCVSLLAFASNGKAVTLVGNETLTGFADVFELTSGAKGASAFSSPWGLAALKSTYSGGLLTLQPNFNTYADNVNGSAADKAYWTNGAGGGNKWFEGSTFVQNASFGGGGLTFEFAVNSYTIDSNYSVTAFVKSFDAGWGWNGMGTTAITGTGNYTVSFGAATAGIVQYGFTVAGVNANPTQESALGSVGVVGIPEPTAFSLFSLAAAGALLARRRKA